MNNSRKKDLSATTPTPSTDAEQQKFDARSRDQVSDPSLSDETGHDWSDEGGATEQGPATGSEESPDAL